MTEREQVVKLIDLAAGRLLECDLRAWWFGDSVAFEALLAGARTTDDQRSAGFAHGFARAWASRATPYKESDNTAAGRAMVTVCESTGDGRLVEALVRLAGHLRSRPVFSEVFVTSDPAPLRQPYGPVQLSPSEAALLADPGPGIFLDCLHFDPPFFAHLGRLIGDEELVDLGVDQALGYVRLLQDDETGLFHHFVLGRTGRRYAPGWGRGQGWALLGLLDVLEALDPGDARRQPLAASFVALCRALAPLQRTDGHWNAVVQEPRSGCETSTAAFAAVAFLNGVAAGLLDVEFAAAGARAWAAIRDAIDEAGVLTGVSAAVYACTALEHYFAVPTGFIVPWGQGPAILAAASWLKHGEVP